MTMLTSELDGIGILDAGILSALGYGVVFVGLIALMIVVIIIGKIFQAKKTEKAPAVQEAAAAPAAAPVTASVPVTVTAVPTVEGDLAPGSAGKLKLHDVKPKTAAMIMAIIAHKLNKPLNELRFISIKEVK